MKLPRLAFMAVSLFLVVINASAMAEVKGVHVENAYLTLPPPMMKVTAGYMKIQNHSQHDLVLETVSSPVAGKLEMHHSSTDKGMATMTQIEQLVIPAHSSVTFDPGAMHLMVMGLKEGLQTGQVVALTLYFSGQQQMIVEAVVRDMREQEDESMSNQAHHHHH